MQYRKSCIKQVVASQDKQTLLILVLKSSNKGAIIGAIAGTYLLGKALYQVLRYSEEGKKGEVLNFCSNHPKHSLNIARSLPKLLIGHKYITGPLAICCDWLMDHSPFPKKFSEPVLFMLSGIIEWGLSGVLVGAVVGPVFLAMNPQQAVSPNKQYL